MADIVDDHPFTTATTGVVRPGSAATGGNIEQAADKDMFAVSLTAGTTYLFDMVRTNVGGLTNPLLQLYSPAQVLVASDDNSGTDGNARIAYTATQTGTFYLGAMDAGQGSGMFTLGATAGSGIGVSAVRSVIGEGENAAWTVTAPVSMAGTTSTYNLIGVTINDVPSLSTGQYTIGADGHGTISVPLLNDAVTDGNDTVTVVLASGQTSSILVHDTSRPTVNVPAASKVLLGVYSAFYGQAPSSVAFSSEVALYNAKGSAAAYAADVAARFAATPDLSLAGSVLNNLKLSATTTGGTSPTESFNVLREALSIFFGAFPQSKGQVVLNLVNILDNIERDVTWGQAAIQYNMGIATMYQGLPQQDAGPGLGLIGAVPPIDA
ncbi:pre-peptidase C-terminal domain-containing protein [Ramlibacter sp.]|uniref:pre-peptidase C-terminal domain-containing protein n=1 Tax=Ramlibacter sp. TaxID=1917967 RepID=UPI003D09DA12